MHQNIKQYLSQKEKENKIVTKEVPDLINNKETKGKEEN